MKDNICHIDMQSSDPKQVINMVNAVWGEYDVYHICNMPNHDFISTYQDLANTMGEIKECHPVNDKNTEISTSRDIKFDPSIPHFFASNNRQPLHTDYAYYEESEAPEWLMLYCVTPSKHGGITDLLSLDTLKDVMLEHNPKLLKDIEVDIVWKYDSPDGEILHTKPILDKDKINWNYYQINKELNTKAAVKIVEEFFSFLEDVIVPARIYDYSKERKEGDCIIFKDSSNLHGRSAFLGDRWLKDHALHCKQPKEVE